MANFLKTSTRQEILRLVQLGWTHRRIARELKVDRGTISRYARLATPGATADRPLWPPCYEDHDPYVEQLRPLARVLLLQARREMTGAAVRCGCRPDEAGHTRDRPADATQPAGSL